MSPEPDQLFARLREHSSTALLAEPAQLRAIGTRRRRASMATALGSVAVVVLVLVGAGVALRPLAAHPGPTSAPATQPQTVVPATASRSPSPTASATPSPSQSSAPVVVAGQPCTAADLSTTVNSVTDGAMGTAYTTYTVTSVSTVDCKLAGTPTLWGNLAGKLSKLPQLVADAHAPTVDLLSQGQATVRVSAPSDPQAFGAGDPRCARPGKYTDLEFEVSPGQFLRTTQALDVHCEPTVTGWTVVPPLCTAAQIAGTPQLVAASGQYSLFVLNSGPAPCVVPDKPTVLHSRAGASPTAFPTPNTNGGPQVISPGQKISLYIGPADPTTCTGSTVTHYTGLVFSLGNDQIPVPGTMTFNCDTVVIQGWQY